MNEKPYYSMYEVAEVFGVSPETIKEWRKTRSSSKFPQFITHIGRKPIVSRNNLERFLDGLPPVNEVVEEGK